MLDCIAMRQQSEEDYIAHKEWCARMEKLWEKRKTNQTLDSSQESGQQEADPSSTCDTNQNLSNYQ